MFPQSLHSVEFSGAAANWGVMRYVDMSDNSSKDPVQNGQIRCCLFSFTVTFFYTPRPSVVTVESSMQCLRNDIVGGRGPVP